LSCRDLGAGAANCAAQSGSSEPLYKVTVVQGTTNAYNYGHLSGSTFVGLRGTVLLPNAQGTATVQSQPGTTRIRVDFDRLESATKFGSLSDLRLWAISPEGRAVNLGELVLDGDSSEITTATELQTFALIVTGSPTSA